MEELVIAWYKDPFESWLFGMEAFCTFFSSVLFSLLLSPLLCSLDHLLAYASACVFVQSISHV